MAHGGTVTVKALLDSSEIKAGVSGVKDSLNGISWGNLKSGNDVAKALSESCVKAGKTLTVGLTAPIVSAGVAAVSMASGFDDAMAKVSTIADTTEVPLDELRGAILDLSDDTGIAANDIADNVYNAISAGQKTGDAVAFVGQAAKLAKAGFTDSAAGLDVLTTTLNAYKMEADQATRVSDVLLMTQNKGKTTVGELASSMGKAIPTASAFGVSLENLAAAYATTTANGIATAESTTYINSMIKELGDTGSDVGKILKERTGQSFAELMDSGMSLGDALNVVAEAGAETNQTMYDMFGSAEAASAAATLASDGASQFTENLGAMNGAAGATDEAFEKMKTTSYDVDKAINRVKNAAIDLGGKLLNALGPSIDRIGTVIEDATKWFSRLSDDEKQSVIQTAALVAAIGPFLTIVGHMGKGISGLSGKLKTVAAVLASVDRAVSLSSKSAKAYSASTTAASVATTGLTTSTKLASVAMGGLKAALISTGIGALIVLVGTLADGIMKLVDAAGDADKRNREVKESGDRLKSSLDDLDSSFDSAKDSARSYASSADEIRQSAEDATRAHKDLAQSLSDSMRDAGSNAGMLQHYVDTVNELGEKSDLTAGEQVRLRDAVDRINEACGTTFAVTDDVNGALYGQVDAINAVVEAKKEQLRYEAVSEGLKDLYKQQEEDLQRVNSLERERADVMAEISDKYNGKMAPAFSDEYKKLQEITQAQSEAKDHYESTGEAIGAYEQRLGELGQTLGSTAGDIAAFASSNQVVAEALDGTGQSAESLSNALSQYGVSVSDLSELSEDKLREVVEAYDGTTQSIAGKLQELGIIAKEEGAKAPEQLAEGMTEGADQAVAAAAEMTGRTVEQIRAECDYFGIEGGAAVTAYASALASGSSQVEAAAAAAAAAGASGADQKEQFGASGEGDAEAYASSVAAGAAASESAGSANADAATDGLGTGDGKTPASGLVGGFAATVGDGAGTARARGSLVSEAAASGMQSQNGNASTWGNHLVQNFASGISGMIDWVASAASSVASTVANILGHTVPKMGPLRNNGKGEREWGEHAGKNFADGLAGSSTDIERAAAKAARAVRRGMPSDMFDGRIDWYSTSGSYNTASALWGASGAPVPGSSPSAPAVASGSSEALTGNGLLSVESLARAVAKALDGTKVSLDGRRVVGELIVDIDRQLGELSDRRSR